MARKPLPGWKPRSFGEGLFIDVGEGQITVDNHGEWSIELEAVGSTGNLLVPAQLAAEDAARVTVTEMAKALGLAVVPVTLVDALEDYWTPREMALVDNRWDNFVAACEEAGLGMFREKGEARGA